MTRFNISQLLLKFHLCTSDSDVEERFSELTTSFHQAAEDKMKASSQHPFRFPLKLHINKFKFETIPGSIKL